MSEEKKAIFLKGYFTANELMRIADEMMEPEPSQDELLEEALSPLDVGPMIKFVWAESLKKRYRITRI